MTDFNELKKLAESADPGPWLYWGESAKEIFGAPIGASSVRSTILQARWDYKKENFEFIAAANPAVILEMIDLIEDLENQILEMGERD